MREILHNCIAHQDYGLRGRISLVESPHALLITNVGTFIPGSVEDMIHSDAPPAIYRNKFLADAMVNLNMIDTIGSGIKKMFQLQQKRSFPMPDFDLDTPNKVSVRLSGQILDERYTTLLLTHLDLDLWDVIALDKVQKKKALLDIEYKRLKRKKLIEGRRPNLYVAAKIASVAGDKSAWVRNRAFDKAYYRDLILAYLEKFGEASRKDLDQLVKDKLSDTLNEKQKKRFVANLLQQMKKDEFVVPDGTTRWAKWRITKNE